MEAAVALLKLASVRGVVNETSMGHLMRDLDVWNHQPVSTYLDVLSFAEERLDNDSHNCLSAPPTRRAHDGWTPSFCSIRAGDMAVAAYFPPLQGN